MAKFNRLNSLSIQRASKPGLLMDGGGLALQISKSGTRSWIFRYTINKRTRMMGLGPLSIVTLAEAREKAIDLRKQLYSGIDPLEAKYQARQKQELEILKTITFDDCAKAYIESHKSSWRNAKHCDQWITSLKTYVSPTIGHLSIQSIDTTLIMKVMEPIWATKNETASRIRSRLELILAWATVRGYRIGENPALWRNHLDKLLPARARVRKIKHFAALPYEQISKFMTELKSHSGIGARALEFLILTATRTNETLFARWQEINFDEQTWTVPGERMKAGVEHRIPLSTWALKVLNQLKIESDGDLVFPNENNGKPLSNMAMLKLIERMGYEVTTHGFRSTFRDWGAERTNYPREVCEQALAHSIQNKVESAYRRGDLLLKRRALMNDWAKYCEKSDPDFAKIIQIPTQVEAI